LGGGFTGDQTNDPFFIPQVAKDILGLVPHGEIGSFRFLLFAVLLRVPGLNCLFCGVGDDVVFTGDLRAWFVGQLEKYMLRPNRATGRALRVRSAFLWTKKKQKDDIASLIRRRFTPTWRQ
jgi:hypothetical protein